MKAVFHTSEKVIKEAALRIELKITQEGNSHPGGKIHEDGYIRVYPTEPARVVAYGTPRSIMRLIGALTDNGFNCLVNVS